jgi:hypothetical protein
MALFEKRKYERFDFNRDLTITADSPDNGRPIEYHATMINISRGGILLYTIAQFKPKTKCTVKFKSNKFLMIEAKGIILRVVSEGRPAHLKESEAMYALEFAKVFEENEFFDILDRRGE